MKIRPFDAYAMGCLVLCVGCGPLGSELASAASSSGTDVGVMTDASAPTSGAETAGSSTGPEATSDAGTLTCGDGVVEADEARDDGNLVNGDGCNRDCVASASLVWEYRSGMPDQDSISGVTASADGRIFAVGAQIVAGDQDRWIGEFKDSGLVWSETYDRGLREGAYAVAVRDSALYVAGTTKPDLVRNAWTAKLDLAGGLIWEDEFESEFGNTYLSNLGVTPGGDVVVVGVGADEGGLATAWTRRYGASGEVQWTHAVAVQDKLEFAVGPGVAVTADQVVVGFFRAPMPGARQALLLAYPPAGGEPTWMLDLPTSGTVYGLASGAGGALTMVLEAIDGAFIVDRATSAGLSQWSTDMCTGYSGLAVALDSQGDTVAIGVGGGAIGLNIRLCKFAAEGILRWGKDIDGGLGDDSGVAVAILPDDRIVAAGRMWGGDEGKADAWLAVFTP